MGEHTDPARSGESTGSYGSKWIVSFLKATEKDGNASVTVIHTIRGYEPQIVAIDADGVEHSPANASNSSTDQFNRATAEFNRLPLAKIRKFLFRVRLYQWAEFRDVALWPVGTAPSSSVDNSKTNQP